MAFGAGVLISAVAYELVAEAFATADRGAVLALGLFAGAGVFFAGDAVLDRMGAADRKRSSGWQRSRITMLWIVVGLVTALSCVAGYVLFDDVSQDVVAFVLAFAAGAILTMLADTMMPEAFEHGGKLVGLFTTLGFALAFGISALD